MTKELDELEQKISLAEDNIKLKKENERLTDKLSSLESSVKNVYDKVKKLETNKELALNNLKEGILGIQIAYQNSTSNFNHGLINQPIEISDGKNNIFFTTKFTSGRHVGLTMGYCERKVNGGTYTVTAYLEGKKETKKITVDGDTFLYIKFPVNAPK